MPIKPLVSQWFLYYIGQMFHVERRRPGLNTDDNNCIKCYKDIITPFLPQNVELKSVAEKLDAFTTLLNSWNKRFKFSNLKSEDEIFRSLVIPSIAHSTYISENAKVACLGSGPGIPGLIVKIVRPDITIDLVDSNAKAVEFMKLAISTIKIGNASVFDARAENLAHDPVIRSRHNCVICRAFASPPVVAEIASGFLAPEGHLVTLCSESIPSHSEDRDSGLTTIGQVFDRIHSVPIPEPIGQTYYFSQIQQISPTPGNYPRSWKKIQSSPLW